MQAVKGFPCRKKIKKKEFFIMARKISVQLYSVREYAKKDFISVLKKIADIGYVGVEPAGFWNIRPSEFKKIANDLGLQVFSSHSPWAHSADSLGEAMDIADALGLKTIVCGYNTSDFADLDAIKRTADTTNAMLEVLNANGYSLMQHNHYWEFDRLDGRLKYDIYRELCPNVKFQLDCFWSTNRGKEDPVAILKSYADSVVAIHMKDGICRQEAKVDGMKNGLLDCKIDLLPLGEGDLPIPELVANIPANVKDIIVELDYCNVEMLEALRRSYLYMTSNGLAEGTK